MTKSMQKSIVIVAAMSVALVAGLSASAQAQDAGLKPAQRAARHATPGGRPLIIGGHRAPGEIVVSHDGDEIYAPGGFSAHGYGWGPPGSEQAERGARNAEVASRSANTYLGLDGIGAYGFGDHGESGYNNPYYGNSYNRYVGYNGVPADLTFGPAFANRHVTADEDGSDGRDGFSPADREYSQPLFGDDE